MKWFVARTNLVLHTMLVIRLSRVGARPLAAAALPRRPLPASTRLYCQAYRVWVATGVPPSEQKAPRSPMAKRDTCPPPPPPPEAAATPRLASQAARLHVYNLEASSTRGRPSCDVTTSTGHRLQTDLPRKAGGADAAAQPVELMLAALVGCKTATAHYVARHLWPRPHKIASITFSAVEAARDERGALALPIEDDAPVSAALLYVRGTVTVTPSSEAITSVDVEQLGALVEKRCPVAASLAAAGCEIGFQWRLGACG